MPKRAAVEKDRLEGDHCITIQIALSCAFGTKAEQAWCSQLEDIVEDSLRQSASGFVDGTETGMGTWTLYIYGRRASTMWKFLEMPLVAAKCPEGSFATIRSGDSIFTKEIVVPLYGPHAGKKPPVVKLQPIARSAGEDNEPKPGDVYGFNFSEGGVGVLVVARTDSSKHKHSHALVYAIGRRFDDQPTPRQIQTFEAAQAVLLMHIPKSLLKSKHMCNLGRLRSFTTQAWPHPPALVCDRSSPTDDPTQARALSVMWSDRNNVIQVVRCDPANESSRAFPEIRTVEHVSTLTSLTHLALRGRVKRFRAGNVSPEIIDAERLALWRSAELETLPQADDSIWRAAKPHEGLVVAFPFQEGGFGVAVIARYSRPYAEYHVFNIHNDTLPDVSTLKTLRPQDIVATMRCHVGASISPEFTRLGNLPRFSRDTWPVSPAMRTKRRDWRGFQCDPSDEGLLEPSSEIAYDERTFGPIFATPAIQRRYMELSTSNSGVFLGDALPIAGKAVIHKLPHMTLACNESTFALWRQIDQLFIERMRRAKKKPNR